MTKESIKLIAGAVAALVVILLVANFWDNITAGLPWSDESKLRRSQNEVVEVQTESHQAQEQGAIYARDRETVTLQPIIIRQVEQGAARIEAAPDDVAAADAFYALTCQRLHYRTTERECATQNYTTESSGAMLGSAASSETTGRDD